MARNKSRMSQEQVDALHTVTKKHSSPAREAYKARRRERRANDPAVQARRQAFLENRPSKVEQTVQAMAAKVKGDN